MYSCDFLNEPKKAIDESFTIVDEYKNTKDFDFNSIYRSDAFTESMKFFDSNDDITRKILLSVNEADQNTVMMSLSNKLYDHIVNKVDDIDFGTIPISKGDITKIENYEQLVDCIKIITDILQQYNQDTAPIEIVANATQNIIDRTDMFTKAYRLNVEMPIIIYNTMVLAIVSSVSYMISSCIEFIKSSDAQGFEVALDKTALVKTRDCILYKDLAKFNKLCDSGEFDKAMDYVINQSTKNFSGSMYGLGSVSMVLGIILIIIPLIRELVFFFYYSRCSISNYFDTQASLLTMNAYNIEHNLSRDEKDRKAIADKQRKIADMFRKVSNAIKIKTKTGEVSATKEISKLDSQKYKYNDVSNTIPDSSNSVLF